MPTDDYDDEDRPRRPRSSRGDEDEDRPRGSRRDEDEDRPRRRRDEEDDYDDEPGRGKAPHRGTMILVFGILGFVCCGIFGIIAAIMGTNDLKEMAAGRMDRSGEGMTRVGQILGFVVIGLNVIGVIIYVIMLAAGGARR